MFRYLLPLTLAFALLGTGRAIAEMHDQDHDHGAEAAAADEEVETLSAGFASDAEKVSYALGMSMGTGMRMQGLDLEQDVFVEALLAAMNEEEMRLTETEMQETLMNFQQEFARKQQEEMEAAGEENLAAGEAFLAENAEREEVTVTDSGLQYEMLSEGEGDKPGATDIVVCHYEGKLLDGTVFDSSYERGQPATFPLNRVIPGWTEGLQLMSPGAKYRLYVPAELAYGPRGAPPRIGPNETLTFDVELIEVQEQQEAPVPTTPGMGM